MTQGIRWFKLNGAISGATSGFRLKGGPASKITQFGYRLSTEKSIDQPNNFLAGCTGGENRKTRSKSYFGFASELFWKLN